MFDDIYEPSGKYTLIRHAFFFIYNRSQYIMLFFQGSSASHPPAYSSINVTEYYKMASVSYMYIF